MKKRAWLYIAAFLSSTSIAWADYSLSLSANPGTVTDFTTHLTATDQNGLGRTVVSTNYNATGPAPVAFSNTSTYSADARFQAAGTYTLQIDQMDSSGIHGSGSVSVTVKPRTNSIRITPQDPSIPYNSSQDFDAIATDQFGNPMAQSNFIWTDSNGNSLPNLDSNGVYQANQTHGTLIKATYVLSGYPDIGSNFSEARVTYPAPVIQSFSATQDPFDSQGAANLTVSATSLPGEQYLIYTWNIPGATNIGSNGTNLAKQTVAHFPGPGVYTYSITVTDQNNQSTTSETRTVTVGSNYTMDLTPEGKSIPLNSPIQLSATEKDQFGNPVSGAFNWTCTGPGTLDPTTHVLTATGLGTITCSVTDPLTHAGDTEPYFAENPSVQSVSVSCDFSNINPGEAMGCRADGIDQFGNPIAASYSWNCEPGCGQNGTGSITPHTDDTSKATFLAGTGPYSLNLVSIGGGRRGSFHIEINTLPPPNNPPTISWTQPADGAVFNQGDPILLEARALDSDGTVTSVSFQSQNGFIGNGAGAGNNLYQNSWTNAVAGQYTLTASAQDNRGATAATTTNITITVVAPLSISGRVTESGVGIAGVAMTLSGSANQTVATAVDGTYSFTNVPRSGNYTVTPAKVNYGFTPATRTITNLSANQTNVDFVATANRYSISGQVMEGGAGLAGVTMTLSGGASQTITTAADGSYSFSNLSVGADYTVTPAKAGYIFAPVNRTVTALSTDQTNINFAATANVFAISGTVTENGIGLSGVSLNLTGGASQTVLTAADGSYSFASLPAGQDYTVRPAKANYSFTPFNRTVTNLSANQGNVDFVATSTLPGLHSISGRVTENGVGLANVSMALSGGTVQYAITAADGSYSFTNLPNGGYTISPTKPSYNFTPAFRTLTSLTADQTNVDFVATPNTFSISGKVTEKGFGLLGVTMTLSGGASQTVTTVAGGVYSFTNLPAGLNYVVTPSAFNYTFVPVNRSITNLIANQPNNDFVANANPHSISGKVTENGVGLAGVTVTLSGGAAQTVTTGANGTYSFVNLASGGTYTVTPTKANYLFAPISRTISNLTSDQINVDFVATANRYTISGKVTEGGVGLAGVTITLSGGASQTVTTAADGTYTLTNLLGSVSYTVTPSKANYGFAPANRIFTNLSANQSNIDFVATLNKFSISGKVTEKGFGLLGVTMTLSGGASQTVTTVAGGVYSFTNLPAGLNYVVTPSAFNYTFVPVSRSIPNLTANQPNNDFVANANPHSISGKVTENGVGLAGVTVTLSGGAAQTVTTGANGAYSFVNLASGGNYTVTPTKANYLFAPISRTISNLTSDQINVDFVATANRYTISGKVTEGGVGLAGVTITLSGGASQTVTTAANGTYTLTNLLGGVNYTVTPSKANYGFAPANRVLTNLSASQANVDFVATANRYTISGKVTEGGVGLAGVTITLSGGAAQTVTTAANGTYTLTNLLGGVNYTVTPSRINYTFVPVNRVLTNLSGSQANVDFVATANRYTISGKVTEGGVGLAGVTITLSGGAAQTVTTAANGTYTLTNLLGGVNYTVTPTKANYTFAPVNRVLTNLSASQVNVDFVATANRYTISGKVTEGGVGLAGVTITLSGGAAQTVITAANGTYTLTNLLGGVNYTVTPSKANYGFAPANRLLTNLSASQANIDFVATANRYTISGKVTEGGVGLAGVTITLSGGASQTVTTAANGTYTLTNLLGGVNYTVVPTKANYSFAPVNRVLTNLSASQANIDFVATANRYTISGKVTEGGVGLAGVTITLSGGAAQTVTTAANGTYTLTNLLGGVNYTVTPSKANYGFAPANRILTNLSASQANIDFVATANRYTISGKVTEGGVGLAGVTITLSGGAAQTVTTAANGTYTLTNLLGGVNYTVTPAKANYTFAPVNRVLTNLSGSQANIDFVATANRYTISGKVTEGGVGLAGVTVTLSGGAAQTVTTAADGSYTLTNLLGGVNYTVTPTKANYTFAPVNRVLTNLSASQANIDFVATANRYTISGKVTEGGVGLAGVTITLSGGAAQTVTTAANGTYTLTNLLGGVNYTVTPTKANYTFAPVNRALTNLSGSQANVDFAATANRYTISGKVTEGGVGLAGVTITLSGGAAQTVITAANGTYTLTNLLGGVNYTVTPTKANYTFAPVNRVLTNLSGSQANIDFVATANRYTISGKVTEGGVGLAGVTITLSGGAAQTVITAANGTYTLTNLLGGVNYTVAPSKANYGFAPANRVVTNLSANQSNIDFVATANRYTISGKVTEGGVGLAGVTITLSGGAAQTVTTAANGTYTLTNLLGGVNYTVTPTKANYTFAPVNRVLANLSASQANVDFAATLNHYTISGKVTEGGVGLVGVTVTLSGGATQTVTTAANGTYSFANLPAGANYTVTPSKTNYGFAPANRTLTALSASQNNVDFVATLNKYTISGKVTESGVGLVGVTVTLSGGAAQTVTTAANGTYSFTNLPAGANYTVTPAKTNYTFAPVNRILATLSASQANVDFAATLNKYTISGKVTEGGVGLVGVTMTLSGGANQTVVTAANGTYSFTNLPAGLSYTVAPAKTNYTFAPVNRVLATLSGNQANVDFAATLNKYAITGKVTESGVGLVGVTMTLSGGATQTVTTAADGTYTFANLPAGANYTVAPSKTNYGFAPVNRVLTALSANQANVDFAATLNKYTISGKVTEGGIGLAGVTMTLSGGAAQTVVTAANGTYSFANLPAGANYTVAPAKTNYTFAPVNRTLANLSAAQANVDFIATANRNTISGKVTEGGVGLAGVTMTLSGGASQTATTAADGSYSFPNLLSGANYTVAPAKTNYTFAPVNRTLTNLVADQANVDFAATINKYTISGKVTEAGVGLSGVTLTLSGGANQTVTTGADGSYSFANLIAGLNYTVTPSKTNYGFAPVNRVLTNLSANQANVDFVATLNKYTISGKVTDTGAGLAGVTMTLSGGASQTATTAADGTYSFANLPAGLNYTVAPAKTNYTFAPVNRTLTNLSANQTNVDFVATINKYTISGKVTEAGAGLAGVTMTLSGGATQTVTTGADGSYSFPTLVAGVNYTVTPSKTNYSFTPANRTLTNLSGNQTDVDFAATLDRHSISGTVTENGVGLVDVTLTLSGTGQTVTTAANGTYSFTNLPAGIDYTVTPSKPTYGFTPAQRGVSNLSTNVNNIDFAATRNTYAISGHVVSQGKGLADVTVSLSGSISRTQQTDADGAYSFSALAAGENYGVTVAKSSYTFTPTEHTINNLVADHPGTDFVAVEDPRLSRIEVTPAELTVTVGESQHFEAKAYDQYGNIMNIPISWEANGGASISQSGAFRADTVGRSFVVRAFSGDKEGHALLNIIPVPISTDVSAAYAYPVPYKSTMGIPGITFANIGGQTHIRIYTAHGEQVTSLYTDDGSNVVWKVTNDSGSSVASGIYLYVIKSPTGEKRGKLIVIQ